MGHIRIKSTTIMNPPAEDTPSGHESRRYPDRCSAGPGIGVQKLDYFSSLVILARVGGAGPSGGKDVADAPTSELASTRLSASSDG